jgi:hypothetical protein
MGSLLALGLTAAVSFAAESAKAPTPPSFKKIVVVYLENTDYRGALRQAYLSKLAKSGALLTDFHAETHPSQPNYVALAAGTTAGVHADANSDLDERHLGDLLEAAGRTWKVYAEDYPGSCFLGQRKGLYVRKHVPFVSFLNVQRDPKRCANIVDASDFKSDYRKRRLPDFSFFAPNMEDDGHETGVKFADRWVSKTFGPLLEDAEASAGVLVVVTFDEDDSLGNNHIYTVLAGDSVAPGSTSNRRYNHYSLLRTIEDAWNLGSLGRADAAAEPISGVWK